MYIILAKRNFTTLRCPLNEGVSKVDGINGTQQNLLKITVG
jgi:hypothetical protein